MPRLALAALALMTLAAPAVARAGPPWMSIEYPANPHDPAMRSRGLLPQDYLPPPDPDDGTNEQAENHRVHPLLCTPRPERSL